MVIVTQSVVKLLRPVMNQEERHNIVAAKIDAIFSRITVDPSIDGNTVDAYVLSSKDISRPNHINMLKDALSKKHEKSHIIWINANARVKIEITPDTLGIDVYLTTPEPNAVKEAIYSISAKLTEKPVIISSKDEIIKEEEKQTEDKKNEKFNPIELLDKAGIKIDEQDKQDKQEVQDVQQDNNNQNMQNEEIVIEDIVNQVNVKQQRDEFEPSIVKHAKSATSVTDITLLRKELDAQQLLKELINNNTDYRTVEQQLSALSAKVFSIMSNSEYPTLKEKLERVKAVMYNRREYATHSNLLIQQYIEKILNTVTDATLRIIDNRLEEIQQSINLSLRAYNGEVFHLGRLAGINEERANLLLDLSTLDKECSELATQLFDTSHSIADIMKDKENKLTGSDIIDMRIKTVEKTIISENSLRLIQSVLETASINNDKYDECCMKVSKMINNIIRLLELDEETISAQQALLKLIKSKNIEDTVIANSLLKKSIRVFVTMKDTGSSIVPYILSYYKSRQNKNVLLVDMTGRCKWSDYGIRNYTNFESYSTSMYEERFIAVEGNPLNMNNIQKFMNILSKSADFYSVINIVLDASQIDILNVILPEVLTVNYLVDTDIHRVDAMKYCINETIVDNICRRVILNKCDMNIAKFVTRLGLEECLDIQILSIPTVVQILQAPFDNFCPVEVDRVEEAFKEVLLYA